LAAGNHYTHGLANGYRSGLEGRIAKELLALGIDPQFEKVKIRYNVPAKDHTYTADFLLPNGIVVETKGRFLSKDRQKHLLIKAQCPEWDLRFVFTNPQARISKASATTYADWCQKNGFKFAKGSVPEAWINEQPPIRLS
jgi:hypothetical protein